MDTVGVVLEIVASSLTIAAVLGSGRTGKRRRRRIVLMIW
jgi:hypothetical protein